MAKLGAVAVLLASVVAVAAASEIVVGTQGADVETNVCRLEYNYCVRDPGCVTYTFSVKNVVFYAAGYDAPVKIEDISHTAEITAVVTGVTSVNEVPSHGSYKVYSLSGHNLAAGALSDALVLDGHDFTLTTHFTLSDDAFGTEASGWFEVGIDVFQQAGGSDEGFCLEISSIEYVTYEENKPDPPFEMYCIDNGDGTFTSHTHEIHPKPVPAPNCQSANCDLDWAYCPRDPGCVTYTMSVAAVEVDVEDHTTIKAGDMVKLLVNGTTSLKTVPTAGSYRIYSLDGHNEAAGVLSDVMSIEDCGEQGCYFYLDIAFQLNAGSFSDQGWFEFGLDVFQKGSGSDEGMCIEIFNQAYATYETTHPQPPPGFVTYCEDQGWGHFKKDTIPERLFSVDCNLD